MSSSSQPAMFFFLRNIHINKLNCGCGGGGGDWPLIRSMLFDWHQDLLSAVFSVHTFDYKRGALSLSLALAWDKTDDRHSKTGWIAREKKKKSQQFIHLASSDGFDDHPATNNNSEDDRDRERETERDLRTVCRPVRWV